MKPGVSARCSESFKTRCTAERCNGVVVEDTIKRFIKTVSGVVERRDVGVGTCSKITSARRIA